MKMTFSDLLTRWNKGINRGAQKRFAKTLGLHTGTISRWANGSLLPGEAIQRKAAKILGVSLEDFRASFDKGGKKKNYLDKGSPRHSTSREQTPGYGSPTSMIPVVGRIKEEPFTFSFDQFPLEFLPFNLQGPSSQKHVALRVEGNSLTPPIKSGEYLVVVESRQVENNQPALVGYQGKVWVRKVREAGDQWELAPLNKKGSPFQASKKEAKILGNILYFIRKALD